MAVPFTIAYTLDTIDTAASRFWQYADTFRVITFSGDMGTGKTTFIKALCAHLKVNDRVSSPTYAIINEYRIAHTAGIGKIYHMDLYRLHSAEEAVNAGVDDCLGQADSLCLIEWPDIITPFLPLPYISVSIEARNDNTREMKVMVIDTNWKNS